MMVARFALIPAAHVYLVRGREVLLQRRHNTGYMDGHWVAGAAGHIESGETAGAAAVREVREELGVQVELHDVVPATLLQRTDGSADPVHQRADWYFTAVRWSGAPQVMEPEKCAEIAWWSLDALPSPVPGYEKVVLDGLARGTLQSFTFYGFPRPMGLGSPSDSMAVETTRVQAAPRGSHRAPPSR